MAETYDGLLNDINGFHVKDRHAFEALDGAPGGAVAEGNVGGGTGMVCYGFKGGIGTSSRVVHGGQRRLHRRRAGAGELRPPRAAADRRRAGRPGDSRKRRRRRRLAGDPARGDLGSIIIVVATDAPLLPHQLKRLARRATLGLARTGGLSGNGSGDIFLAFSTANPEAVQGRGRWPRLQMLPNEQISPVFDATAWATEEAIVNALVAAETMTGADGRRSSGCRTTGCARRCSKYNRLAP